MKIYIKYTKCPEKIIDNVLQIHYYTGVYNEKFIRIEYEKDGKLFTKTDNMIAIKTIDIFN